MLDPVLRITPITLRGVRDRGQGRSFIGRGATNVNVHISGLKFSTLTLALLRDALCDLYAPVVNASRKISSPRHTERQRSQRNRRYGTHSLSRTKYDSGELSPAQFRSRMG